MHALLVVGHDARTKLSQMNFKTQNNNSLVVGKAF